MPLARARAATRESGSTAPTHRGWSNLVAGPSLRQAGPRSARRQAAAPCRLVARWIECSRRAARRGPAPSPSGGATTMPSARHPALDRLLAARARVRRSASPSRPFRRVLERSLVGTLGDETAGRRRRARSRTPTTRRPARRRPSSARTGRSAALKAPTPPRAYALAADGVFGQAASPVFVPPWNRIAPALLPRLRALGFRGLSTFRRSPRRAQPAPGLAQINTHLDPIDWRGGRGLAARCRDRWRRPVRSRAGCASATPRREPDRLPDPSPRPRRGDLALLRRRCWSVLPQTSGHSSYPSPQTLFPCPWRAEPVSRRRSLFIEAVR